MIRLMENNLSKREQHPFQERRLKHPPFQNPFSLSLAALGQVIHATPTFNGGRRTYTPRDVRSILLGAERIAPHASTEPIIVLAGDALLLYVVSIEYDAINSCMVLKAE